MMIDKLKSFGELRQNLNNSSETLPKVKIALLGDTSTQFLNQALAGYGYEVDCDFDIYEAEYDQIENEVFNGESELYGFEPEVAIFFFASHKFLLKYNKATDQSGFADSYFQHITQIYETFVSKSNSKVIFFNFPEINDAVYGNFSAKVSSSFIFQLRKLNFLLMDYASQSNLSLCDLSAIQNQFGHEFMFSPSIYVNTEMVLSLDVLPYVAKQLADIIVAQKGHQKKCIILDLDNTVWGGVIGDDGLDHIEIGSLGIGKAFSEFQYWVKKLKKRGIIVAVCSKNTESVAKEPFEKHPDMVLKLDDISVFVANWENKADNIRNIQQILNIGFDSMVFVDDNAFERNIVRENLPDVCVPELPEDPAEYLEYLYQLNLFETTSVSKEDSTRTELYKVEAERQKYQSNFTNVAEYLKRLDMQATVENFTTYNIPRISQLSQRSNQFNLRTVRYSEGEVTRIAESDDYVGLSFALSDKFGNHGLICVVILKKLDDDTMFIDTWFMSCRVLKRGVESFVLNQLVKTAERFEASTLRGEYIPTEKNAMVKDHYKSLGFVQSGEFWDLSVAEYDEKECFIQILNDNE